MSELLCESCQEPVEIVEQVMVYGDVMYHKECFDDYCLNYPNDKTVTKS